MQKVYELTNDDKNFLNFPMSAYILDLSSFFSIIN